MAAPAASAAPAPARAQSETCEYTEKRFDLDLDRMGTHQRVAWQLHREALRASGAERRTLEHRASTQALEDVRRLEARCGYQLGYRLAPVRGR